MACRHHSPKQIAVASRKAGEHHYGGSGRSHGYLISHASRSKRILDQSRAPKARALTK